MLCVTRRENEGVVIGKAGDVLTGPIHVTVFTIAGARTKLGIDAPDDITVHRSEVQEEIDRERADKLLAAANVG